MAPDRTRPDRLTISASWVNGLVEVFRLEGLDVTALFRDSGLDLAAVEEPHSRFPHDGVNRLWQLAVSRSGNPTIGLAAACVPRPGLFGVVAYVMLSSPDLRGLLERIARYVRILTDAATVTIVEDKESYRISLVLRDGETEVPWQRAAFDLMSLLAFVRWAMLREIRPLSVELMGSFHEGWQQYQEAFGCDLHAGAAANALVFSLADVGCALPTAQPQLAGVHERIAGDYLARLQYSEAQERIHGAVLACLAQGEPSRAAVARTLGMGERTLRRRLEEAGVSFRQILDDTRKEMARRYFDEADLSLADMAYLLGYHDQSSFFRATRRWFGTTPQRYRKRQGL